MFSLGTILKDIWEGGICHSSIKSLISFGFQRCPMFYGGICYCFLLLFLSNRKTGFAIFFIDSETAFWSFPTRWDFFCGTENTPCFFSDGFFSGFFGCGNLNVGFCKLHLLVIHFNNGDWIRNSRSVDLGWFGSASKTPPFSQPPPPPPHQQKKQPQLSDKKNSRRFSAVSPFHPGREWR